MQVTEKVRCKAIKFDQRNAVLEKYDLSKSLGKADYKRVISELEITVGTLQREIKDLGIPVLIVFEGWESAGKGTMINRLILSMDPRGFKVYNINPPNEEERFRPFLWRFWSKTPERGRMAVFNKSWYGRVLEERVIKKVRKTDWATAYTEINSFERQLFVDDAVIIKFFLHISKEEQKKRFEKLAKNSSTEWKVTEKDWLQQKKYFEFTTAVEEMLAKTDTAVAPWTVVESHDRQFATVKIYQTFIAAVEKKIHEVKSRKGKKRAHDEESASLPNLYSSVLDKVDLSLTIDRENYKKQKKKYQKRIWDLEHEIYTRRIPVVIVFQGWDAAGKGGSIRRLVQAMDPRGYEVIPFGAPNDIEKAHHYLWRFWVNFPKAGHINIFDRSWYGRVLVERVEGFCREDEWKRAYGEINEMEEQWVHFGTVISKFWLHIDSEEQLRRFEAREVTSHKQWKITQDDWRNRDKWDQYKAAVDEMLLRTSTPYAPWTIVEANSKLYARIKVLKTVVHSIEARL